MNCGSGPNWFPPTRYSGITDRFYGEGDGPILLDNVECLGVESTILECLYDSHTADCNHSQDAGVVCLPCESERA